MDLDLKALREIAGEAQHERSRPMAYPRPLRGAGDPVRDFDTAVAQINRQRADDRLPPLDPELVEAARPRHTKEST